MPQESGSSRRSTRLLSAIALAATLVLASCSSGSGGGDGGGEGSSGPSRDELVIAASSLPTTFAHDGGTGSGYENEEFTHNTQASLLRNPYVKNAESGEMEQDLYSFEGVLAESYSVSTDGLTYTFLLRKGVKSTAGNDFTADDVIWSYERKLKAPTSSNRGAHSPVITDMSQFTKIDPYTLTITIPQSGYSLTLLSLLANSPGHIYDSTLLKQHVTAEDPYAVTWSMTNANYGFGPYKLDTFTAGQEMVLVANDTYALGSPAIKKITYRVVADPGTRANSVRAGDVDIAVNLRPADKADLAKADGVTVHSFANTNLLALFGLNTTLAPFNDAAIREAFAYAIPYQQIIDNVYRGYAERRIGFLNPTLPGYTTDGLTNYTYDPAKAKKLLATAGYADGVKFTLTVSNSVPDIQDLAVQVQSYAKDAGFDVTVNELPPAAFNTARVGKELQAYSNRAYAIVQTPTYDLRLFFAPKTGATGWEDQAYYDKLAEGNAAQDALAESTAEIWLEAEQIRLEAMPMAVIAAVQPLNALRSDIDGYANRSDAALDFFYMTAGG